MKIKILFAAIIFTLSGYAISDNHEKSIPIHLISIGFTKEQIVEKLGPPHRVVGSEIDSGKIHDTWMYERNETIWVTGNEWLGGKVRVDRTIYLLEIYDNKLVSWRDTTINAPTEQ